MTFRDCMVRLTRRKRKFTLYLEKEQAAWMDEKVAQGYKKSQLVRMLINECLSNRATRKEPAKVRNSGIDAELAGAAQPTKEMRKVPEVDLEGTLIEETMEELASGGKLEGKDLRGARA